MSAQCGRHSAVEEAAAALRRSTGERRAREAEVRRRAGGRAHLRARAHASGDICDAWTHDDDDDAGVERQQPQTVDGRTHARAGACDGATGDRHGLSRSSSGEGRRRRRVAWHGTGRRPTCPTTIPDAVAGQYAPDASS